MTKLVALAGAFAIAAALQLGPVGSAWAQDDSGTADDSGAVRVVREHGGVFGGRPPARVGHLGRGGAALGGEHGTAVLNHRDVEVIMRQDIWRQQNREGQGQKIALLTQPKWLNHWLIEQFTQWRDGGPPMETRVEENVQACALVFAAIESQARDLPINVQEFIGSFASTATGFERARGVH